MRQIILTSALSVCIFASCGKDNGASGYREIITFSQDKINILAGGTDTNVYFNPVIPGDYKLECLNPEVATATLKRDGRVYKITIETHAVGEAAIRAVNTRNDNVFADLTVNAESLNSDYYESPQTSKEKIEYLIELSTPDDELSLAIQEELHGHFMSRVYTIFDFNAENEELKVNFAPIENLSKSWDGTFSWDSNTQQLVVNYNDTTEVYTTHHLREGVIGTMRDYTEYFKLNYPDAGIISVKVKHFLSKPLTPEPPHFGDIDFD